MNESLIVYVRDRSPCDGAAYTIHLLLATHADHRRYAQVSQAVLADESKLHPGSVRRVLRSLVDDGHVELVEPPRGSVPALLRINVHDAHRDRASRARERAQGARAPTRASRALTRAQGAGDDATSPMSETTLIDVQDIPVARARTPRAFEPSARAITDAVFEQRNPKPAQKWIAVAKIAEALLTAGWNERDVLDVMLVVPTISTRWCESELHRIRSTPAPALVEPRSGQTFVGDPVANVTPVVAPASSPMCETCLHSMLACTCPKVDG